VKPTGVTAGAALLGVLALSGCSWFSSSSSSSASSSKSADPCPTAVILRPLANTAVFGPGPEHRPDNVAFYGILSEADLKCEPRGDAVKVTLDMVVAAERGPAGTGDSVDLPYFVAVTTPDQSVISKKPFTVRIAFEGGQRRAGVTDHIEETIPLDGHKAPDLNVILGFQQSPDVVAFYKRFRGR
jgi:hypothetical protein